MKTLRTFLFLGICWLSAPTMAANNFTYSGPMINGAEDPVFVVAQTSNNVDLHIGHVSTDAEVVVNLLIDTYSGSGTYPLGDARGIFSILSSEQGYITETSYPQLGNFTGSVTIAEVVVGGSVNIQGTYSFDAAMIDSTDIENPVLIDTVFVSGTFCAVFNGVIGEVGRECCNVKLTEWTDNLSTPIDGSFIPLLDLGDAQVGMEADVKTFTVSNLRSAGACAVAETSFSIGSSEGNVINPSAPFSVTPAIGLYQVCPGDTKVFDVGFMPTQAGEFEDEIPLQFCDQTALDKKIILYGKGIGVDVKIKINRKEVDSGFLTSELIAKVDLGERYYVEVEVTNDTDADVVVELEFIRELGEFTTLLGNPPDGWELADVHTPPMRAPDGCQELDGEFFIPIQWTVDANSSEVVYECYGYHKWHWVPPLELKDIVSALGEEFVPDALEKIFPEENIDNEILAYGATSNAVEFVNAAHGLQVTYTLGVSPSLPEPINVIVELSPDGFRAFNWLWSVIAKELAAKLGGAAIKCAWVPGGAAAPPCVLTAVAAGALAIIAIDRRTAAYDPRDDFDVVANPRDLVVPTVDSMPQSLERDLAVKALRLAALSEAHVLSYTRYLGAVAADDEDASVAQFAATQSFDHEMTDLLREIAAEIAIIQPELTPPDAADVAAIQQYLSTNGLPSALTEIFTELGYTAGEIQLYTQEFVQAPDETFTTPIDAVDAFTLSSLVADATAQSTEISDDADVSDVSDISGDDIPDIAVLGDSASNGRNVRFFSGANGDPVFSTNYLNPAWTAVALDSVLDTDGDGATFDPSIALLARNPETEGSVVQVRRADTGAFVRDISFLNPAWDVVDVAVINDTNGDGVATDPSIGVLGFNPITDNIVVQIRQLSDGSLIGNRFYLNTAWQPLAIESIERPGSRSLVGVLARNPANGAVVVQSREVTTGSLQRNTFFLNPAWNPRDIAIIGDLNQDGVKDDPGLLVLAENPTTGNSVAQVRRVSNGQQVKNLYFLNIAWRTANVTTVSDLSGNMVEEAGVWAVNIGNGNSVVQILDYDNGSTTINIFP